MPSLPASSQNEHAADALQTKHDELTWAKERSELRLQSLNQQMLEAEKADAKARLAEIHADLETEPFTVPQSMEGGYGRRLAGTPTTGSRG